MAALENHLWQSTLFCCVVALLTLVLRRNRAAVRYGLWLTASVKFLIPFSLLVTIAGQIQWHKAPPAMHPELSIAEQVSEPFAVPDPAPLLVAVPTVPSRAPAILFAVWLCGFAVQCLRCWWQWRQVRAAVLAGWPVDLGLSIPVISTPSRLEPGVFGLLRPVLLLPDGLIDHLTPSQWDSMIAHELCHVRRRDNLMVAIHMVTATVFWFHPMVWWIEARLLEERERACDEEVLGTIGDPEDCAEGLVKVCKFYLKSPLICSSGVSGSDLRRRVEAIMMNRNSEKLSVARSALLVAAAITAMALPLADGLFRIPPVRAQQMDGPTEFDAVSVKPSDPNSRNGTVVGFTPSGGLHISNATVKDLIETAYDVRAFQIVGGPGWADSAKYDVVGTPDPNGAAVFAPGNDNVRVKVQAMLKDRFHLQLHRESRTEPIYSLVIARSGIRPNGLRSTTSPHKGVNSGRGTMLGEAASMDDLAWKLSRTLGRPVGNNTGLEGNFDFKLEWTADAGSADSQPGEASLGASLFSAVQQELGLRLEAIKGPVDVLIIDQVDKPTEN